MRNNGDIIPVRWDKHKNEKIALYRSIALFDVYEGERVPDGKKSVAYNIVYRAADRSLTGEEVQKSFDKAVRSLEHRLGAQLR